MAGERRQEAAAALRREMYAQVPVARAQIRALRNQAEAAAVAAEHTTGEDHLGHVLTSVMLAGFALELALKIFGMTYGDRRPRGHNLKELFDQLPAQVQADISASFAASNFPQPPITVYGLIRSEHEPPKPSEVIRSRYDTAENVILYSANSFRRARYFFEEVRSGEFSTIENSVHYMIALSHVLDVVYDEYRKAGGWGSDLFARPAR